MTLLLPSLRADQSRIVGFARGNEANTAAVAMGRRWGKSTMAGAFCLAAAYRGWRVAWIVPTYKNGRPLWRFAERHLLPLAAARRASLNRSERVAELAGGGFLGIYSADSPDSVLGEAFHLVVIDEAARVPEEVWTDAIQPTLADYGGKAMLISTPKGRNWFWREWQRGMAGDPHIRSFQSPSSDNPNPRIQAASAVARGRVSERTYRQEWLAEFIEDGGEVFRGVRSLVRPDAPHAGPYVAGIDWGREHDYTVVTVIEAATRRVVHCERWTGVPYAQQLARLLPLFERLRPEIIVAEQNSMGGPIVERLFYEHELPIRPWNTTHQSKAKLIDALALAVERQAIGLPDLPWLLAELEAYAVQKTSITGLPTYGAPAGMHDDGVISLALAWQGALWFHGGDV